MTDEGQTLDDVLQEHRNRPPNILQGLLAMQDVLGYIPSDATAVIARQLDVTEAEVAGVLSFYPDIRRRSPGRHIVRICMGESCIANRSHRVLAALGEELRIGLNGTTPDRRFTLERVYCMGNCAVAPSVMIDEDVYGHVDATQISLFLDQYK
jgi:NADH:ubiquinone oxidoreductase subunit E